MEIHIFCARRRPTESALNEKINETTESFARHRCRLNEFVVIDAFVIDMVDFLKSK